MSNSIRVVKPVAPIKVNNHWVYRVDDTKEVKVDGFLKWADEQFMPLDEGTPKRIVELFIEYAEENGV